MSTEIEKFITDRKAKNPKRWAKFEDKYRAYAVGMLLAEYREQAGVSLTELAKLAGMHKTALSRLENHGEDVRFSTLARYVEATGKPMLFKILPQRASKKKAGGVRVELQPA
jgi:transcriptional regulator with XRE-family HTH domain